MGLKLLLVEDDRPFADALAEELGGFDHAVTIVEGGRDALLAIGRHQFDAVILDRMIPQIKGIDVLHKLRAGNIKLPIIMLSALGRSGSKVEGLDAGADDYVVKPVAASELNARLHAVLRGRQWTAASDDTVRAGAILISPSQYRASVDGTPLELGKLEFDLLAELARNADAALTRAMLVERVWKYDFLPDTNIVDVYVHRLRLKLATVGRADAVVTVRGVGYMLRS